MRLHRATLCMGLLGLLLPALAQAADPAAGGRTLRVALATDTRPDPVLRRTQHGPARRNGPLAPLPRGSLGQRALEGLLDASEGDPMAAGTSPDSGRSAFRFRRQGNAGRDLREGYKDMCDRVSNRLWDEPNGKRVKFDVAGKPGVGFEIPLN